MPSIDPEMYLRNLAALRLRQPEVAEAIESATGPEAALVEGRDGTLTIRLSPDPEDNAHEAWLGGSSMPTVTSEELFRGFTGGSENVIIPGVMAGREVLRLADRFHRHAAIFIIERSAYALQLVLRLCDYSRLISQGRLVLLVEGQFESQLLALFSRFPGYAMPARMLTIPHRAQAEHAEVQRRLEQAGAQVARQQAERLARLRLKLARFPMKTNDSGDMCKHSLPVVLRPRTGEQRPLPPDARAACLDTALNQRTKYDAPPRMAVISTDAGDATVKDAARVAAALAQLGWARACCIPDQPDRCHAVARLQTIADSPADVVFYLNSSPGALRVLLPEAMPVFSWFFAEARIPSAIESPIRPLDLFIASSAAQQTQLVAAGVPEEQVYYAGIASGQTSEAASGCAELPSEAGKTFDAIILSDLPDDRPEAAGITVSTHASLWREAMKIAGQSAAKDSALAAADLLDRAEDGCGVKLREPKIRGDFLRMVEERVLPTAFARNLERALSAQFKVAVRGTNWQVTDSSSTVLHLAEGLLGAARRARWTVLPFFSTASVQLAVDLLTAGARVALRTGRTPLPECHPELTYLAPFVSMFKTSRELVELLRTSNTPTPSDLSRALRSISIQETLVRLVARVREKQSKLRSISAPQTRPPLRTPCGSS